MNFPLEDPIGLQNSHASSYSPIYKTFSSLKKLFSLTIFPSCILYMKSGREASNRRDWLKGIALIDSRLAALVLRGNSNNNVKFYNVKL